MGGEPSTPNNPAPAPSTGETSAQAIQAQIDALPKILAAQQQYGGQFSEEQLKSLNQYGPQFAQGVLDLQKQFSPQYKALSDSLNPEIAAAQGNLTNFLNQTDDQEYASLAPGVLNNVRAGQSQRGLGAISPRGSVDESVQLAQLKSSLKDRRLNISLATAGRTPIGGIQQVQPTTGTGQLVQNIDPNSALNYQSSLNNFNASIFNTQGNNFASQNVLAASKYDKNSRGALGWII